MTPQPRFPVVGVGASAGGVDALRGFFAALPEDVPAAFLVVLHTPPYSNSQLAAVIGSVTRLGVSRGTDGETVRSGHVYVATPDRHLLLEGPSLRLSRGPRECRVRPAIDVLFRSLALTCGTRAAGVVLSGLLDDGTAGLWAIKQRRGHAYAQDPQEAQHPSMPESAAEHVDLDLAAPVAMLAHEVAGWCRQQATQEDDQLPQAPEKLTMETRIAAEANALRSGVMALGPQSPYACPDCHGVLLEIREGRVVRFRCHTGHAFSAKTLLAELDDAVDNGLWSAMRAMEERKLLLRLLADQSEQSADPGAARHYAGQARELEHPIDTLRKLVLDSRAAGYDAGV